MISTRPRPAGQIGEDLIKRTLFLFASRPFSLVFSGKEDLFLRQRTLLASTWRSGRPLLSMDSGHSVTATESKCLVFVNLSSLKCINYYQLLSFIVQTKKEVPAKRVKNKPPISLKKMCIDTLQCSTNVVFENDYDYELATCPDGNLL